MTIVNNDKVKDFLDRNNILYDNISRVFLGSDCYLVPVTIAGEMYYFKFLDKCYEKAIKLEINAVNYLRNNGVKVPEYFLDRIFIYGDYAIYATKEVKGIPIRNSISYETLQDAVRNIALLHKAIIEYPSDNVDFLDRDNDYNRMRKFSLQNKAFIDTYNFSYYVSKLLDQGFEKSDYHLIHADLNFNNIFVNDGKVSAIIDFTDMKVGYLEDDLGKFWQNLLYLDGINIETLGQLLQIYEETLCQNISLDNLLIGAGYRVLYRYFCMINNNEPITEDYNAKTKKIMTKIINREVR